MGIYTAVLYSLFISKSKGPSRSINVISSVNRQILLYNIKLLVSPFWENIFYLNYNPFFRLRSYIAQQDDGLSIFLSVKTIFWMKNHLFLTILSHFCLVLFSLHKCFAVHSKMNQQTVQLLIYTGNIQDCCDVCCGDPWFVAAMQTNDSTIHHWNRGATPWVCTTEQWGK